MARFDTARVREYYDRQSAAFVVLGQGGAAGVIRRAVWGPGVASRTEAFHFVDDRVLDAVAPLLREAAAHRDSRMPCVLDLGCGVGGSLVYLAARAPIRGLGITLSSVQARMAGARVRASGLGERVRCVVGDFTALPLPAAGVDVAFAIESLVHAASARAVLGECARVLRPGGQLLVCDDVRRPAADPRAARAIERYCEGWHVNSLLTRDEIAGAAHDAGFAHEATLDLTPWLELGRPRDRAIAAFVRLCGWLPLRRSPVAHVAGGSALQTCLRHGWVAYELLRFRRPGPAVRSAAGA